MVLFKKVITRNKIYLYKFFPFSRRKNSDKNKSPIILIGKGVTFDSGGLNVKPSGFMHEMHMDMSGGAAVLAAISTVARLKLKKNVIALIPAAENAISDDAMRARHSYL